MDILSATEVPVSYQIATGLSTIGCVARRSFFIDQVNWKVYPSLRILLVGPSGIGKDTAIDRSTEAIQAMGNIPILGGRTYEYIADDIAKLAPPAVAYIPAPEISAFIGKSSYQESMVQRITDLLSDKQVLDIGTKSNIGAKIYQPTISIQAGSTPEWLQSAMPEGSLEGGFFPRFLIVPEEYTGKHIPLVKQELSAKKIAELKANKDKFNSWLKDLYTEARSHDRKKGIEIILDSPASDYYKSWYFNRRKYFADTVRAYAERSRDQVLRLAFLLALSRGRTYCDEEDLHFAISFMNCIGRKIADVVIPPSMEGRCMKDIQSMLPNSYEEIVMTLAPKYSRRKVQESLATLLDAKRIKKEGNQYGFRQDT